MSRSQLRNQSATEDTHNSYRSDGLVAQMSWTSLTNQRQMIIAYPAGLSYSLI